MNIIRMPFLLLLAFLSFTGPTYAHHLWVAEKDGIYTVMRGHMPDQGTPYAPECVKDIRAYNSEGAPIAVDRIDGVEAVSFKTSEPPSAVTLTCDWGYRVLTTRGKKFMTRREAVDAGHTVIEAFFSTQFAKVLFDDSEAALKASGLRLELVPLALPAKASPGSDLQIKVLLDGKPLPDAALLSDSNLEVRSDANGTAAVPIEGTGWRLLSLRHKLPVQNDPDRDYHLLTTFLIFEAK